MVIHWRCPVVHCVYLSIPIIGKLRGFGRGVISFVPAPRFRIVAASQTSSQTSEMQMRENRIISLRTRNSPLCARGPRHKGIWRLRHVYVRAACRAMPCRVEESPRNEKRQCISSGRIRRVRKKNPRSPRRTPGFSIVVPRRFIRALTDAILHA